MISSNEAKYVSLEKVAQSIKDHIWEEYLFISELRQESSAFFNLCDMSQSLDFLLLRFSIC